MMSRRRHHLVERLSEEGQTIVIEGLERNLPYQTIADRVRAETGESIGESSIGRYYTAKFAPGRKARLDAKMIADRLTQNLGELSDQELQRAVKLRATEALLPLLEALGAEKPAALAAFVATLDGNRVMHARIDQRRDEISFRERKLTAELDLAQQKLEAIRSGAKKALEKPRTPAELKRAILSLHGLSVSGASPGGGGSPLPPPGGAADSPAQESA